MRYKKYDSLDSLPRRQRKAIKNMLFDGEEFVMAIDCRKGRVRSKHNKKLVVTDARVFSMKKGLMRRASEDYSLNDISSIQFSKGIRKSKIRLQGSGIDDEYPAKKSHGEAFVAAVREQINR